MKFKTLIMLGIIFLCLLMVVVMKKSMKPKEAVTEKYQEIISAPFNLDDITSCDFYLTWDLADKEPPPISIVKDRENWVTVGDYNLPVNKEALTNLINKVNGMEGELRSSNAEIFEDYGISDKKSLHIILRSTPEQELVHLVVGTERPDWQHNFVRLKGSEKVYVTRTNLLSEFGFWEKVEPEKFDRGKWIDKHLSDFDVDKTVSIEITKTQDGEKETILNLIRKTQDGKKKWEVARSSAFRVSEGKIKNFLIEIKSSLVKNQTDPAQQSYFDKTDWQMKIMLDDTSEILITRGEKVTGADDYYFKVSGASCNFIVSADTFKSLDQTDADFFIDNPLGIEESEIKELNIKNVKKKQNMVIVNTTKKSSNDAQEDVQHASLFQEGETSWKDKNGKELDAQKVRENIKQIKDITLRMFPGKRIPEKNIFMYSIVKNNGETIDFDISKELEINGKEYNGFKLTGNNSNYFLESNYVTVWIESLSKLK
ncbi:MAG: DUF4340 domain-containing protein [Candidatus Omnitrophota bacterium]